MKREIIPNFLEIFEGRIKDQKKRIQFELDKPKKERDKHLLKTLLRDTKSMQKRIKEAKKLTAKRCPHCDGLL